MLPFLISFFLQIAGPGASSGIVYDNNQLYIVSDNSDYLYHYDLTTSSLKTVELRPEAKALQVKKHKLDLESIAKKGDILYMMGSASKANRKDLFLYNIKTGELTRSDFQRLFEELVAVSGIPAKEINIEGLILFEDKALLFNRGNGPGVHNGIFTVESTDIGFGRVEKYNAVTLPKIGGIESGFSDAVLIKKNIYFLGTGEQTDNSIDDGEIKGSYIGKMKLKNFKIRKIKEIAPNQKFEGLTWFSGSARKPEFLLCEDADDDSTTSTIYNLKYAKN